MGLDRNETGGSCIKKLGRILGSRDDLACGDECLDNSASDSGKLGAD
jgi:hypothetical protein